MRDSSVATRPSVSRDKDAPVTLRALTRAAERAAASARRKRVAVAVRLADDLRAPATGRRRLRSALALLTDDAVARAPRESTVLIVGRLATDSIVFEVRDADRVARKRPRPAHRRVRQLAAAAGWGFRVTIDAWAGTRAILALSRPGRQPQRRVTGWTTCVFSRDDNFVMPESVAPRVP